MQPTRRQPLVASLRFNRELDENTAQTIIGQQFVEVIIAPPYRACGQSPEQQTNVRVLISGEWTSVRPANLDYKRVNGGLLVQDTDLGMVNEDER